MFQMKTDVHLIDRAGQGLNHACDGALQGRRVG